ncbi:hypothetical protein CHS0354_002281 [Potamilus streckersoni]|uniref:Death domain-containing protein n=1 Tax=Potamilus streckersoni TaxID=2493646 RepID=A0AAE0VPZ7_9BIVA|nr:hypothetical protein CHS0354_002281 [Potamilus streckersoni]
MNERLKSNIKDRFQKRRGCPKKCKIIIYSDKSAVNTLLIEIMKSNRVGDRLKILKSTKPHLHQIEETTSDPVSIRYGEKVRIYATEGIQLHSRYKKDYLEIRFQQQVRYNRQRFEVVRKEPESSAVLKFKLGKKECHECHFLADDWLRQRNVHIFHQEDTALCMKSIYVLASKIPINKTNALAAELDLDYTAVEHLNAIGHKGTDLTAQIIFQWCRNGDKKEPEMVLELSTALNMLQLGKLASKLEEASKAQASAIIGVPPTELMPNGVGKERKENKDKTAKPAE